MITREGNAVQAVELEEGTAEYMGDGLFIVLQGDAEGHGGPVQNVVLTEADLKAMQVPDVPLTISLEDGEAHYAGDEIFLISQADEGPEGTTMQNVTVTSGDIATMLRTVA